MGRILLLGVVLCLMAQPAGAAVPPAPPPAAPTDTGFAPRDVVILVDVSSSMDDIFARVQAAVRQFIDNARPQDRITLVAFSDDVSVVSPWRTASAADRDRLKAEVDRLAPRSRYTNITAALQRGVGLLRDVQAAEDAADRVRLVLLITDGRHNPPTRASAPTFDSILQRYANFHAGTDWFVHYIAVRDVQDDATQAFVRGAQGQVSLLTESSLDDLAARMDDLSLPVPVTVRDTSGRVTLLTADGEARPLEAGTRLRVGDVLMTGPRARAVLAVGDLGVVGVDRDTRLTLERARHNPNRQTYAVSFWVPSGRLFTLVHPDAGRVAFQVQTPHVTSFVKGTVFVTDVTGEGNRTRVAVLQGAVEVHDAHSRATAVVGAGRMITGDHTGLVGKPVAVTTSVRRAWGAWQTVLAGSRALRDAAAHFVRARWNGLGLTIGPLQPNETYEEILHVDVSELEGQPLQVELIRHTLPEEIEATAVLRTPAAGMLQAPGIVKVVARVPADYKPPYNRTFEARVRLIGPALPSDVQSVFRVRFFTAPEPGAGGPLTVRQRLRRRVETTPAKIWWGLLMASVAGPLLFYVGVQWWEHTHVAVPLGRLLLTSNPVPDQWTRTVIDLEDLGKELRGGAISIGSAPDNVVTLPDVDVQSYHAEIRVTGYRRANRRCYLHIKSKARVLVNGQRIRHGSVQLLDKMRIELGGFEFLYEDTKYYQQVEVAMRDKRVVRGVLHSWDLAMPDFLLAPDDTDMRHTKAAEMVIRFKDVEDITVFKAPHRALSHRRKAVHGVRADLLMRTGRTHQGWLRQDYKPTTLRFYFFPAGQEDVDYLIVERASVQQIAAEHAGGTAA